MSNAVTIENLSKSYGKKEVLVDLSFNFPANRVIGLLGENGIGKTTLLKLLADILKPDAGYIRLDGELVSRLTREKVSFLLRAESFYGFMTVQDAIHYYRDFYRDFDIPRAWQLAEEFGLNPKEKIKKLSSGVKERLCILLCLCRRVPLYVLDEPVAGLDPKFKHESVKAMLAHIGDEQTVIIASHLLRDLETIFDEIVILRNDSVLQACTDDIRALGKSVEQFYLEAVAVNGDRE